MGMRPLWGDLPFARTKCARIRNWLEICKGDVLWGLVWGFIWRGAHDGELGA